MHGNDSATVNCVNTFHSISIADFPAEKLVSLLHKAVSRNACSLTDPLPSAALSQYVLIHMSPSVTLTTLTGKGSRYPMSGRSVQQ